MSDAARMNRADGADDEFILDRMQREALEAHASVAEAFPDKIPFDNGHEDITLRKREWGGYKVLVDGVKIGWVTKSYVSGEWSAWLRGPAARGIPLRNDPHLRRYALHEVLWKSREVGRLGFFPSHMMARIR